MLSERRPPTANNRVGAFLESQRGLMSYYAAEGKSVAATWPNQSSGDSRPGSPMLVPRAAAANGDVLRTIARSASPDEPVPTFPIDMDESTISKSRKPRPANSSKSTRVIPIESRTSQRKSVDRERSDDEPERLKRLEQRRNRRQARRYAMGVAKGATNRGDKASEVDRRRQTNKRQESPPPDKLDKKKGKVKVTPALLLMQNFSSQSLGGSRLTMRPSPTVGVFNKGKNSGRVTKKGERVGRLVPDIVFSESKFLNKTPSARNCDEDTGSDSDSSDDHSAHSLAERARRQQYRAIKSSQRKVIVDHVSCSGSPIRSPPPAREESPPWDIEATVPSSPSSAKSLNHSSDNGHSNSPAAHKHVTVSTERSTWASKLRNPDAHTLTMPKKGNFLPGPHMTQASPAQARTTSAYFAQKDMPREPHMPVVLPDELDAPKDNQQTQQVTSCPVVALYPASTPSTPECLQLEHARLSATLGCIDVRTPRTYSPSNNTCPIQLISLANNSQMRDIQHEWEYEVESEPEERMENYITPEHAERVGWTNEHGWNDSDIPGRDEYGHPRDRFLIEPGSHEVHSCLDYSEPSFDDRAEYLNDEMEYLHDGSECLYEDTGRLDGDYALHGGDDLEYGNFSELDDYNSRMHDAEEQEYYHSAEWPIIEDSMVEYLDPVQTDPELDGTMTPQEGPTEAEGEWAEQTPRLLRVITETSLQDDLLKSMSAHWSAAHKLY